MAVWGVVGLSVSVPIHAAVSEWVGVVCVVVEFDANPLGGVATLAVTLMVLSILVKAIFRF